MLNFQNPFSIPIRILLSKMLRLRVAKSYLSCRISLGFHLAASKYLKRTKDCMHLSYLVFNLSLPYRAPIGDFMQTPLGWEFIITTVRFLPGPWSSESSALSYKLDSRQLRLHHRALQAISCSQVIIGPP